MNSKINDAGKEQRRFPVIKIVFTIVSGIIAAFYVVSALGWVMATYFMARSGQLGNEAIEFYRSLNILDHVIRSSQVLLIVVASVVLLLFRKVALKLLLVNILLCLVSFILVDKWTISFLGWPYGLLLLMIIYAYAYFLNRRGFLH